uniref:Methyltransferase domain-containing protein n=1 Tax=Candidatus Kentrum sp. DK TaxID=2126562 RepID=A0A450T6I6_9GAMM|nr:MAG: Methyltransferase domain-containing protein [Candidatus Kentron sp. DK]
MDYVPQNATLATWRNHTGPVLDAKDEFKVIDCATCGFKHVIPIPTENELATFYREKFYLIERKADYVQRQQRDLDWWNRVFHERFQRFEKLLGGSGRVLDVGCGPGFFLAHGRERGWQTLGIEPSEKAATYAQDQLGLDVHQLTLDEFSQTGGIGQFDLVYSHGVLEHLRDPIAYLNQTRAILRSGGLAFISVANDYNPFQTILWEHQDYPNWWLVPPEHINYFDVQSVTELMETQGFEIVDCITTFPMELFLLMGDNYVGDDRLGSECHARRKRFEAALDQADRDDLKQNIYRALASLGLGRQVEIIARLAS